MPSKKPTQTPDAPAEKFEPFSWLDESLLTPDRKMLMLAKDMTVGVQLIERATVDENDAYMTGYHRGVLMRFAIASCSLFHGAVEEHFDSIRDNASKEDK